ncbi:MAG: SGNH/GDSL hydrolase family protein [Myxococcota bacterium]
MNRRLALGPLSRASVGAVAGALLGGWLGLHHGAAFVVPDPLDPTRWSVLVPGLDENVVSQRGRGTQVVGGAIVLTPHVFHRSDVVLPRDARPIAALSVELAPDSGQLDVRLRSPGKIVEVQIRPDAWRSVPGAWTPHDGPVDVRIADGEARIGGVRAGLSGPASVELVAARERVRIRGVTLVDEAGEAFLVEDPGAAWEGRAPVGWGVILGALAGAGLAAAGGMGGLLVLAFPVAVALTPPGTWLALVERLYLVRTTPWALAQVVLAVAFVPMLVRLLARSGLAVPAERDHERDPRVLFAWVGVAALAAAFAGRVAGGPGWMFAPIGLGLLLAPLAFARAARVDAMGVLVRDVPAALAVGMFGWGVGLLGVAAWRMGLLVAGAGVLLRRAPRVAADAVFLLALALVPAAELAARSTWLDTAWDAARLDGDQSWTSPAPFWDGECGPAPRATVTFAGGSSTGGAYQFHDDPAAFYPSRVHARLCAEGRGIRTTNHGYGGRDSFTVSRSLPTILAAHRPAVVVAYLGVNDLLTQESPLTRAQREAIEAGRSAATRGLAAIGARSRLLTGVALLARPPLDPDAAVVSDVPLADAEANLRRMAAGTLAAGTWLVLLPEYTDPETRGRVSAYANMEARLAAELPGIVFLDTFAALAPFVPEGLLVDRNHLSRTGSERLGEVLAPILVGLLDAGPPPRAVSSASP